VSIEYIQSMGDWKTAWDHIHFKGFLGTPMVMQFTWQGCDSILAAPLVIDLVRLTERAWRGGERGVLECSERACVCTHGGTCTGVAEAPCVCPDHRFGRTCELSEYECAFERCNGASEECSARGGCVARSDLGVHAYPVLLYVLLALSLGTSMVSIVAIVRVGIESTLARLRGPVSELAPS